MPVLRPALRLLAAIMLIAGLAGVVAHGLAQESDDAPQVHVAELVGPIGPATATYLIRAIEEAEAEGAAAVILETDTPGGLDAAMRDINQAILGADVPVILYVSPAGARAASAGAFIMYASHLAAMAPGTSVGAATPVQMGGGEAPVPSTEPAAEPADEDGEEGGDASEAEPDTPAADAPGNAQALRNKAVNDAAAYIRSLAELRGRNADWAERAVREAASLTADQALEQGVIEIRADDIEALLAQADGRTVALASGETTLAVAGADIVRVEKTFAEEFLATITDPNLALLLVNLGFLGLVVSFYNGLEPVTLIAGAICLIVGFYGLNTLPLNYAGAALIVMGLGLLVAEAFVVSYGLLTAGGLIAFVIGALMLVDTDVPAFRIHWAWVIGMAAGLGGVTILALSYGLAAQLRRSHAGSESMVGDKGKVTDWSGREGHVLVQGEHWRAVSDDALSPGDAVTVIAVDGLTLTVKAAGG
ncbi:hypothetical protein DDZ18_07025 [Marinicauda salina]|uniref:Uncharacterized protein n=1 Tax=Marinicauda salina TaxID=2135793 RepID=A0A2U2BTT7_9PROT|nr:nodulation protein NfeD [Marinicauda salina]PWE17425.1 hypothetical protein DDZ18_07025 [Marinicauda salina]